MTTDTMPREVKTRPEQPRPATLEQLLDDVREDSGVDALEYLEETKVPHGGE